MLYNHLRLSITRFLILRSLAVDIGITAARNLSTFSGEHSNRDAYLSASHTVAAILRTMIADFTVDPTLSRMAEDVP